MTTEEPSSLTALIAAHLAALLPDSHLRGTLEAARDGHRRNAHRRAAVLKHEDLRKRLEGPPLSFRRANQWNGYVPPAIVNPGESEVLRQVLRVQDGSVRFWLNPAHKRAQSEVPNTSPQRAALVDISAEAWRRERADDAPSVQPAAANLADLLPKDDQPPALPADTASAPRQLDAGGELAGHADQGNPALRSDTPHD